MTWSVDAAFAVHNDIQSHTGAFLTTGKWSLINLSMKQKINSESSTEAKLLGIKKILILANSSLDPHRMQRQFDDPIPFGNTGLRSVPGHNSLF